MPEFDLNSLKKTWQQHEVKSKYGNSEIVEMLNRKSRNYVKYILWISLAELLIFLGVTLYYILNGDDGSSFIRMLSRLGVTQNAKLQSDFEALYFGLKVAGLLLTAFFVVVFYRNYRKIRIESNLKKFTLQIMKFRRTVNAFILSNILLLIAFTLILTLFVVNTLSAQNIHLNNPALTAFIVSIILTLVFSICLIWLYYRLVYGIFVKRLGRNLAQLKEIEETEE